MSLPPPRPEAIAGAVRRALPEARAAWLFGSAAQGRFRPGSDIDIAFDVPQPLPPLRQWEAQEALAQAWNLDVDLLDFRRISTVMQYQVLATGQLLFSLEPAATSGYCGFVLNEYQRIQSWRRPMARQLAQRLLRAGAPA
ncbi:MAG: nucleotidyltransferase domain-containing protein [Acidovorax sp.]